MLLQIIKTKGDVQTCGMKQGSSLLFCMVVVRLIDEIRQKSSWTIGWLEMTL